MSRLRSQDGFVVPVVLAVLVVALILVGVAASASLRTTDTATRDVWSRQAFQAAEAGVETAAYRNDALSVDLRKVLSASLGQCVVQTSGALSFLATNDSWCPAVTEDLGSDASYSYRVSALLDVLPSFASCPLLALVSCTLNYTLRREIVSTGMGGPGCPSSTRCVKRRVLAVYSTSATTTTLLPLLGLRLLNNLNLQLYTRVPGSLRECSAAQPVASDPSSGC